MAHYLLTGTIKKTKGLTGEVRIKLDESMLYKLKTAKAFFIETGGAYIPYLIDKMEINPEGEAAVKFNGVNTLEQANMLAGKNIYIEEKRLTIKTTKKERDWLTLEGYLLYDKDIPVGHIEGVYSMPGQHIAAVDYHNNEILVPLLPDFIKDVDDNKKHIYMELPDGLLDIYTDNNIAPDED